MRDHPDTSVNMPRRLRARASDIPQERLEQIARRFRFDPETGIVTRDDGYSGHMTAKGYINFGRERGGRAHQIGWFLHYGEWPARGLDHINGDRADNRITNLRLADQHQNMGNVGKYRTNTSGFKGVSYRRDRSKWMASIMEGGKSRNLGCYATPEAAHQAYCAAARRIFGEFARFG